MININFRNFTEHFTVQNNGGTMDEQGWKTEAWFKEMFVRLLAGVPAGQVAMFGVNASGR